MSSEGKRAYEEMLEWLKQAEEAFPNIPDADPNDIPPLPPREEEEPGRSR